MQNYIGSLIDNISNETNNKKKLYIVVAYDDEGEPYVYGDHDNLEDASFGTSECNGIIRVVEV